MSLDFGFGYTENDGCWSELFKGLTDLDKQFFHNCLPWVCMGAGVGKISEETIPHLILRTDINDALHRGPQNTTTRSHLTLVHLAAVYGEEAAAKYRDAQVQAAKILADALPEGFEPDPVKAMWRFIGFHTNVRTEPTAEFLKGLMDRRMTPLPKITQKDILRIEAEARKQNRAIGDGTMKHPGLEVEIPCPAE